MGGDRTPPPAIENVSAFGLRLHMLMTHLCGKDALLRLCLARAPGQEGHPVRVPAALGAISGAPRERSFKSFAAQVPGSECTPAVRSALGELRKSEHPRPRAFETVRCFLDGGCRG